MVKSWPPSLPSRLAVYRLQCDRPLNRRKTVPPDAFKGLAEVTNRALVESSLSYSKSIRTNHTLPPIGHLK